MKQDARNVSTRTKVLARALLIPFLIGVGLILALFCFAADLMGVWQDLVARIFPAIPVLLVYDAGAALLLRLALALSLRLDRSH